MAKPEDAKKAAAALDGKTVGEGEHAREMRVTFAKARSAEDQAKAEASMAAAAERRADRSRGKKPAKGEQAAKEEKAADGDEAKKPKKKRPNRKKGGKGGKGGSEAAGEDEAAPAKKPAPKPKSPPKQEEVKKPGRDFGAEKLARKTAEMPDIDPDIDLAALRAKAQGAKMSDEEKKARGLLYDANAASAVRDDSEEEDDGGADIEGGDPFAGLDDY